MGVSVLGVHVQGVMSQNLAVYKSITDHHYGVYALLGTVKSSVQAYRVTFSICTSLKF